MLVDMFCYIFLSKHCNDLLIDSILHKINVKLSDVAETIRLLEKIKEHVGS
jgi:hypothetical protein